MWFQRFFGDTQRFGLKIELHDDPHAHPDADPIRAASWGKLEIWVHGRCLTQSTRGGQVDSAVEWYLDEFVRWSCRSIIPLLNEEPFPNPTRKQARTGADWVLRSESAPWTMREAEEDHWFATRWSWRHRHELFSAFPDADAPYVVIRRLGDFIEFSWDNDTWRPSRRGLLFTEALGKAQVGAIDVASIWSDALGVVISAVESRSQAAFGIAMPRASRDDWRWLVPTTVGETLRTTPRFEKLVQRLGRRAGSADIVVPHSVETLLLRDCSHLSANELEHLLSRRARPGGASDTLQSLRAPHPAPFRQPWQDGYRAALRVRDALGWKNDPAPHDLPAWLAQHEVDASSDLKPSALDSILVARSSCRPLIDINDGSKASRRLSPRMLTAAALGVWLLDAPSDSDFAFTFSSTAHWPTTARAKAFAAMLLMPESGIRAFLDDQSVRQIDGMVVRDLMSHFGTTMHATLNHLNHMELIADEERLELEAELGA